jgi:hypothetical protein
MRDLPVDLSPGAPPSVQIRGKPATDPLNRGISQQLVLNIFVNLYEKKCDYTHFFEYQSPCTHAIAACRYSIEDPFQYFPKVYTALQY